MQRVGQFLYGIAGKVGCQVIMNDPTMQEVWLLHLSDGGPFLYRRDISLQAHQLENILYALQGSVWMQVWIAQAGIAGDTREHRRLGNVQLRSSGRGWRILQVIVHKRGSLGSIGLLAIVGGIQVHGEYLLFGKVPRHLRCQDDLLQFTYGCILVADDGIFDQLLCNGAAAGNNVSMTEVCQSRTDNAGDIKTWIRPEVLIFDGNFGMNKVGGDAAQGHGRLQSLV